MKLSFRYQYTVKPRFSAFQGTTHIHALKRGHAFAGIRFTIAKFKEGAGERNRDIEKEKMTTRKRNRERQISQLRARSSTNGWALMISLSDNPPSF